MIYYNDTRNNTFLELSVLGEGQYSIQRMKKMVCSTQRIEYDAYE